MRDATSDLLVKRAISPVSVADNTALVGQIIDGRGFGSLVYAMAIGAAGDADATFGVLIEEGNEPDLSDAAPVADIDLNSQDMGVTAEAAASFTAASDDQVRKIGYAGSKRYTRLTITPASNASAALISAVALLGRPDLAPVTQAAS